MNKKKKVDIISKIPNWAWLLLSLLTAVVVWTLLSRNPVTARAFPPLTKVFGSYTKMAVTRGVFWSDIASSLISAGVGRTPQIIVICIATFLTISITVFQGVINVDETLIKAARVLGANDVVLFTRVIFPATTPFIITSIRLGISVALTTLIAAESTGASAGLGMRIRALSSSFETEPMMLYIIVVGVIGMLAEKILKFFERRLTSWQEKREI